MLLKCSWQDQQENWAMQIFIDGVEVLGIPETAKRFDVSTKTIHQWLKENTLESKRYMKRRFVTLESIERWEMERNK